MVGARKAYRGRLRRLGGSTDITKKKSTQRANLLWKSIHNHSASLRLFDHPFHHRLTMTISRLGSRNAFGLGALLCLLSFLSLARSTLAAKQNATYVEATGPGGSTVYLLDDRKPALYTQNFGSCLSDSLLSITRFDAAYYADNMTVSFHLQGSVGEALTNTSIMSMCLLSWHIQG